MFRIESTPPATVRKMYCPVREPKISSVPPWEVTLRALAPARLVWSNIRVWQLVRGFSEASKAVELTVALFCVVEKGRHSPVPEPGRPLGAHRPEARLVFVVTLR